MLITGNAPGCPVQTGQVFSLGAFPNSVEQVQNNLLFVFKCACTSSPITGSNSVSEFIFFFSVSSFSSPSCFFCGGTRYAVLSFTGAFAKSAFKSAQVAGVSPSRTFPETAEECAEGTRLSQSALLIIFAYSRKSPISFS